MKKACLGILILFASIILVSAQSLIGIPKQGAEEYIRKELKGFNLDNSSKNESFNYRKLLNTAGTKTLIVFFSEENVSTHTRMICDYSEFDFIKEDFNKRYKIITGTSWEYNEGNEKFQITLEEKEWYFVITTKKK